MWPLKVKGFKQTLQGEIASLSIGWMSLMVCFGYFVVQIAYYKWVLTDSLLENHYQSIDSENIISDLVDMHRSRRWVYILIHQFLILTKIVNVTVALYISGFISNQKLSISGLLRTVIFCELLVLIFEFIKLNWLILVNPRNLEGIIRFSPLSLANVNTIAHDPYWVWHMVSQVNLFEIAYIAFLCCTFQISTNLCWSKSLRIVLMGYGSALLFWLSVTTIFLFYAEVAG